ncbi:maleylpyruvate isomerase family mycothiol-dependent enzyme [Janibacter melonis]|uniref:maleylpyruvate isomerase family mycothiol-dependent enzyme n=1 Tax=Janibacter melonis TaxID=262209 RepID=UPI00209589EA|nr:maleylpyruvate isomerase family mycothiol-dependent enzyme [Janibacter melonis]
MSEIWHLVHAERRALVGDLCGLAPSQWDTPSLAPGWSVHDVAAHLVDNALTTPSVCCAPWCGRRGPRPAERRGRRRPAEGDAQQTLARLREVVDRTSGPPTWLASLESRLVEEVAHGEDIRGALGIRRAYPAKTLEGAARYQAKTPDAIGGGRSVARAVRLVADDTDLVVGQGPEVRGPALAIVLLLSGRRHAVGELHGPGLSSIPARPVGGGSVSG